MQNKFVSNFIIKEYARRLTDMFDLVIQNGTLIDPEKKNILHGHLGICNGTISAITTESIHGKVQIDAKGQIVSPGFIDVHGHIDGNLACAELSLLQGVTTTVGGNCGFSPIHLKRFLEEQKQNGFPIHQAELIGHCSLREFVGIKSPYIAANSSQIKSMEKLVEAAFEEGAIGLSFGLEYAPGSSEEEVLALSKIAAKYNKRIPIHTNVKTPKDIDSLHEAIRISEVTGAPILISHFVYQYGASILEKSLEIVDNAIGRGIPVAVDSGMYTDFATSIGTTVFAEDYIDQFGWKIDNMLVASGKYKGQHLNKSIYEDLRQNHKHETIICFTGIENDIYEVLSKDYIMVSSDTGPSPSGLTDEGHPQNAGTFPRFFRKMVREQKKLSLLQAIEKCTLLPANTFDFSNKGRLQVGADADIVIFDIDRIADKAQFPDRGRCDAKPEGIDHVIVNGKIVVQDGQILKGNLPGSTVKVA